MKALYIAPGSPWKNGYNESFYGSPHDERPNGKIFGRLAEAKVMVGAWRRHYNTCVGTAAWLPTTGTRNGLTAMSGLRFHFAPPPPGYGGREHCPLTINTVHSVEADH